MDRTLDRLLQAVAAGMDLDKAIDLAFSERAPASAPEPGGTLGRWLSGAIGGVIPMWVEPDDGDVSRTPTAACLRAKLSGIASPTEEDIRRAYRDCRAESS